jgi:hypothetical protein
VDFFFNFFSFFSQFQENYDLFSKNILSVFHVCARKRRRVEEVRSLRNCSSLFFKGAALNPKFIAKFLKYHCVFNVVNNLIYLKLVIVDSIGDIVKEISIVDVEKMLKGEANNWHKQAIPDLVIDLMENNIFFNNFLKFAILMFFYILILAIPMISMYSLCTMPFVQYLCFMLRTLNPISCNTYAEYVL